MHCTYLFFSLWGIIKTLTLRFICSTPVISGTPVTRHQVNSVVLWNVKEFYLLCFKLLWCPETSIKAPPNPRKRLEKEPGRVAASSQFCQAMQTFHPGKTHHWALWATQKPYWESPPSLILAPRFDFIHLKAEHLLNGPRHRKTTPQ